uniref:Uncharacterized protein n=1 Tax=mine drainage metagenome TaxID=410659 RepID=E6QLE4_9ZZZZ
MADFESAAFNLGIDVLKKFKPFTINFSNMWQATEQTIRPDSK